MVFQMKTSKSTKSTKRLRRSSLHRLVCLQGKLRGETFILRKDETTLGRISSNDICVKEPSVSRHHVRIDRRQEKYFLTDLESLNGSRVNNLVVQETVLRHGDEIRIGDTIFHFLEKETPPQKQEEEKDKVLHSTKRESNVRVEVSISPDDTALVPTRIRTIPKNLLRKLDSALDLLSEIAGISGEDADWDTFISNLLNLLLKHFPAGTAGIMLLDEATGKLCPMRAASTKRGKYRDFTPSQTVIEEVRKNKTSLLCRDALSSARLARAKSVIDKQIRSVICTPLLAAGSFLGILYLDNRSPKRQFNESDLRLLKIIAGHLALAVHNFILFSDVRKEVKYLQEHAVEKRRLLVGKSPVIAGVIDVARRAAGSDATILILGESGTGKEILAESIHRWSRREGRSFAVINCVSLSDQLLESELFGHEKGAFTGAIKQKKGKLELADGGTILLDEIGDIQPEIQARLLRFLENHEFERVGGAGPIKVNVRVIAATNRDVKKAVIEGTFRDDLYYRLRVIEITMPPLRERREDIPLLAKQFHYDYIEETRKSIRGFSKAALEQLCAYSWPGNIRELKNTIERAVVLSSHDVIDVRDLHLESFPGISPPALTLTGYHEQVKELKKEVIRNALSQCGGVKTRAARQLGLQLSYLSRLMKNLGMR